MKPICFILAFWFLVVGGLLIFPLLYLVGWSFLKFEPHFFLKGIPVSIITFTYVQAFLSSVLSGIVGVFLVVFCREREFLGRRLIVRFCEVTFFLPTLLVVLALVGVWGNRGWLGRWLPSSSLYGWFGVLVAHVFLNFSVYFKIVGQSFEELDRTEEKVALSLGASRWVTFWRVSFPKLKSSILQSFWLVFLYCASSFFILLVLGGGPKFSGIETAIYQAVKVDLDIPKAVSLASIQLMVCAVIHSLFRPNARLGTQTRTEKKDRTDLVYLSRYQSLAAGGVWFLVGLLVLIPILNLILSGIPGIFKLTPEELAEVAIHSLFLGLQVSLTSTVLAFSAAYSVQHLNQKRLRKCIEFVCMIPVSLSTMVLGAALILVLSEINYIGSDKMWVVVLIQSLSALPIGFRILHESFSKIERELYFSARSLGASEWQQLLFLEIPSISKSIGLVAVTAFGISLGEAGSVLLFESQGKMTLPLWMFKLIGKYQFEEAQGIGVILLIIMVGIFLVKEKWESSN